MSRTASERGAIPTPDDRIPALLQGGPADLPADQRECYVRVDSWKVKVVHRGGYEHFEREAEPAAAGRPVVFRWTTRTRMAE